MAQPDFDRRPGALEATRGLARLTVCGTRCPGGQLAAGHGSDQSQRQDPGAQDWHVLVLVTGPDTPQQVALTPAQAEQLAAELTEYAGICRGEHAVLQQRRKEQLAALNEGGAWR